MEQASRNNSLKKEVLGDFWRKKLAALNW